MLGKGSTMELSQFLIMYLSTMLGSKPRPCACQARTLLLKMSSFYLSVCLFVFVCWAPTSGPCAWEAIDPSFLSYRSQFLWGIVYNTARNIHVYLLGHLLSALSSICPGAALVDHTVILYSVFLKNCQALFHSG